MSEKYLHEMIDDIEVLIDEAKPARFSPGKIMIEKDVLMTVIEELRKHDHAYQIRACALFYVNEIMEDVQGYVASVKEAQESVFNQLLSALDSDLASIKTNAKEIEEQLSGVSIPQARTRTVEDFISDED